jgi:hypothetical protein
MALAPFQKSVCRLLARNRIASGESYVARGSALNEIIAAPRISRDIDLFHDTEEAALERREIRFHAGSIRGALPQIRGSGI